MKEIIVLILVLVSLFSCSKSDVVQVSGRIENGDSIVSILVDDSIYTLSLDQQGFFSGKIDMVKGGYATMLHNALNLYLSPGEDLEIYVNAKNFSGSLYFRGSLGGINSYLKEQEIAVFFDKDYYALNEEEFVQKMRALIDEKVKLLEAKNFDDSFTELEKQRIGYSIAVRASLYPSFRRNMYPDEDYRPGSVFSDFLSSFSINNERLIGAKDYRDFLLNYVYIQGSRGAQGWENYSDGIADYILATVNSQTIKSFLLTQLVYNYICENNGIEGADYLLSVFHQECTDPNKIAYIDGMVELWEKILPGHDAPDFALRDTEGKTVTLEAFRGSYLYIMVWATWCVPCKSELPYLNLLQKKYAGKNIQFLTVAVGRNADEQNTWLNFLHQNPYAGNHTFSGAADKFAEDYMIISVPRFILIGPDGKILNSNAPRPSGQILQLFETLEL